MALNIRSWFTKHEPPYEGSELVKAKEELENAEKGLREDLAQTGPIKVQKNKADTLIARLDGIIKENNIGPSVERSLHGKHI